MSEKTENKTQVKSANTYYFEFIDKQSQSILKDLITGGNKGTGLVQIGTDAVKKWFERKSVSDNYRKYIEVLMLLTDFYKEFFDLSLSNREHFFNSQRLAKQKYLLMKISLWAEDDFWSSFLDLYAIKREKEEIGEIFESEEKKNLRISLQEKLSKERIEEWSGYEKLFKERFETFYETYEQFIKKCGEFQLPEQSEKFRTRFQLITGIYLVVLMMTNLSNDRRDNKIDENKKSHKILLENALTLVDILNKVESKAKEPFGNDLRMLHLHSHGDRYLYENAEFKHIEKLDDREKV